MKHIKLKANERKALQVLNSMFETKDDYGDFIELGKEKVRKWIDEAEDIMDEIERLISMITGIRNEAYAH